MKNKKLLGLGLMLGVVASVAGTAAFAQQPGDPGEPVYSPYEVQRNLMNLGSSPSGSFDLTNVSTAYPPVRLRLHMENPGENNVNVRIPSLGVSYMVPGKTVREHELSMLKVGKKFDVPYTVEVLPPAQLDNFRKFIDISHLLSASYAARYVPPPDEEPTYWDSKSPGSVRGYW